MDIESFACVECGGGLDICCRGHCLDCGCEKEDGVCDIYEHTLCSGGGESCSAQHVVFVFREDQPLLKTQKWIDNVNAFRALGRFGIRGEYDGNSGVDPDPVLGLGLPTGPNANPKVLCGDRVDEYGIEEWEDSGVEHFIADVWCMTCFNGPLAPDAFEVDTTTTTNNNNNTTNQQEQEQEQEETIINADMYVFGDNNNDDAEETAKQKEPCRYGKQCYQKNPKHHQRFSH